MSNIVLHAGKAVAEVQLRGAQLASFQDANGRELIWQADPAVWPQHAPVLFPVCGSVPNEGIRINGTLYPMTKHGFTRNPDFQVVRQGEDFVEMLLTPTEESKPMYPFEFAFHVIYTMTETGVKTTFLVENKSDKPMPFCVGGHPGFAVPMEDDACFEDYQLVFPNVEEGKNALAPNGYMINGSEYLDSFHNTDTLPLSHDLFDARDALIFTELKSRSVKLVSRKTGHGIDFSFPKMEVLAVWSKPNANAPYLCLEPWHGMPSTTEESGDMENKAFVTILQPGMCWQGSFAFQII